MASGTAAGEGATSSQDSVVDEAADVVAWSRFYWEKQGLPNGDSLALMASLGRVEQMMTTAIDAALKPHGLGRSRYLLLLTLLLTEDGSRRMNRLGWHMMVHPTTVTVVVDQMEADGLLRRAPHPTDRRATLVHITPAGRALAREASQALAAVNFGLPQLPNDVSVNLIKQLTAVRERAGDVKASRAAKPARA